MAPQAISQITLDYYDDDGTVTVEVTFRGDESRPRLNLGIPYPSAELAAAAMEVRERLTPHGLAALRAAMPAAEGQGDEA